MIAARTLEPTPVTGALSTELAISPLIELTADRSVVSPGESVTLTGRLVIPKKPYGDLNQDGVVDVKDIFTIGKAYGSTPDSPNWNPDADVNDDGKVDVKDLFSVVRFYGQEANGKTIEIQQLVDDSWVTLGTVQTGLGTYNGQPHRGVFSFVVEIPSDFPTPSTLYLRAYFPGGEY
ncbi:hypothetical protein DRP04_01840 [Archaeoglobales archaeon]|nr:MAG: hypothetical protein DRP04_01840 [Archaeoglobales archaeon]